MADQFATQNLNTTLTGFALEAFRNPGGYIYDMVAPPVPVGTRTFEYYIFNNLKELITTNMDTERAAKGTLQEVNRSYTSTSGTTVQHGLKAVLSEEEGSISDRSVIDPERDSVNLITSMLKTEMEQKINALLFDSSTTFSSYTAAASEYWDASSTDIEGDIDTAKESVRKNAGVKANTIVIPPNIAIIAKKAGELRDLVVNTDSTLLVNGDLPPRLFGLNVVIPGALNNEATAGVSTPSIDDVHDDKSVWVGYVPQEAPSKKTLGCFYRFVRPLNGNLDIAGYKWYDDERFSNVVAARTEYVFKCVAPQCGYVISGCDA